MKYLIPIIFDMGSEKERGLERKEMTTIGKEMKMFWFELL